MAISLNDNIQTIAPKPIDDRYYGNDGVTPWADVATALANTPASVRYIGLTLNINGVEYRFKTGTTNGDFVEKVLGVAPVDSVSGRTGAVVLDKSDVGLSNVDDTSDIDKPLSTAANNALADKADISSLSSVATSGDYNDLINKPDIPDIQEVIVATSGGDYTLLSAALSAGVSGTIKILNGVYEETTDIVADINNEGVRIVGESVDNVIIRGASGYDLLRINSNWVTVENITLDCETNSAQAAYVIGDGSTAGTPNVSVGNYNTIKNCKILGKPEANDPAGIFALYVAGASYNEGADTLTAYDARNLQVGNRVQNCYIKSPYRGDGVSFSLQKHGYFVDNIVEGTRIAFYMNQDSICARNVSIDSSTNGIYVATPSKACVVTANSIYNAGEGAINIKPQVEHTGYTEAQKINNLTVTDNNINVCGNNGIEINNSYYNTVANNNIEKPENHGIYMQETNHNIIESNIIKDPRTLLANSRGSGIYLVTNVVKNNILNNMIIDTIGNAHTAIANREGSNCPDNTFIGNYIRGFTSERAFWMMSDGLKVNDNRFEGGDFAGVLFQGVSYSSISGNYFDNNTQDANNAYANIWLQSGSTNNTIQGNIIKNTGTNKARYGILFDTAGETGNKYGGNIFEGAVTSDVQDNGTNISTDNQVQDVSDKVSESFDTVSKNLGSYPATYNYTSGELSSIVYNTGSGSITKTFNYTGGKPTSVVLSGDTPNGIDLTMTLTYTGDELTNKSYS